MRRSLRLAATGLVPALLAGGLLTAAPATAAPPTVLSVGHVDAPGIAIEDGGFHIHAHDEDAETEYEPEDVILHAKAEAETTIPAAPSFAFLGSAGDPVWVLPQVEDPDLLFLGIGSEEIAPGVLVDDEIGWALEGVSGPGSFHLYTTGIFGDPTVIFDSDDPLPQSTTVLADSHSHANWAFGAPGEYTVTYRMTGELVEGGPIDSGPVDFTFFVSEASPCDGEAPSVSIGDVSVSEGDSGKRAAKFAVTLSEPALADVTVDWQVTSGSASAPGDVLLSGAPVKTLKFKAGTTSKYVTVRIAPEIADEADEEFGVSLSNATGGYVIARGTAAGTIVDDDPGAAGDLRVGDVSACEGNSGKATKVAIPVTLSAPAASLVTLTYRLNEATAGVGTDFVSNGNLRTLTFKPGQSQKYVTVTVLRDTDGELDERFTLDVESVSGPATLVDGQGVVTIHNDDEFGSHEHEL